MSAIGSSLFNLGIILLIFSAIIYIIKNKLAEMDKRIDSLSKIMEEIHSIVNSGNKTPIVTSVPITRPVVSDDEDNDDSDSDNDSDSDSDSDDEGEADEKINEVSTDAAVITDVDDITDLDNEEEGKLAEVNLLQKDIGDEDAVLGISFKGYDSIDDNLAAQQHAEGFKNNPEPGIFVEKVVEEKSPDYSLMNVKELKKIVSEKGGKVSGKTKDELINYLNSE
tara:strand:- start:7560 stop:8228 length:669 start_codon:yes stop_codon:yes gene_type:complete